MERKVETYGSVTAGKLSISYRSKFEQAIRCLPDCRVRVTVEKLYRKRSTFTENGTGQNGFYHHIVVTYYQQGAWETQQRTLTHDQAHEELKNNCNYKEYYNEETGTVMRTILSTSTLTTIEFEEYLQRCREFIEEWFSIRVPLPNEQGELELKSN